MSMWRNRFVPLRVSLLVAVAAAAALGVASQLLGSGNGRHTFPAADYRVVPAVDGDKLLIGANYTHFEFPNCTWGSGGIIANYRQGDTALRVHEQLREMRRRGVGTLRILVWHLTDASHERWGPVPSAGGRLEEPYRTNLALFLTEIKRFGFARVTIAFAPVWTNDPLERRYDPSKFDENWHFIEDVRNLARRFGPKMRFDLLNEGAPSRYLHAGVYRQVDDYLGRMWANYVRAFGKSDVTVSVIAPDNGADRGARLQNLIRIFTTSGYGQPRWYEIHANYAPDGAVHALRDSLSVLRRNRLHQPIVVGEISYNDAAVVVGLRRSRIPLQRFEEVVEWSRAFNGKCNVAPPYQTAAYQKLAVNHHDDPVTKAR